jgi:hypothetical protein
VSTATSKTIDDAILEARAMVNDSTFVDGTLNPTRNSDTLYLTYLNSALRALYSLRPDAFIGNFSQGILSQATVLTYDTSDLQAADGVANPTPPAPATPFPCDDRFFYSPVVAYIAGRIELADDEYTDSSRSALLLQAFAQQLKGP